jgi:anti-sigma regulatory factor (Ser/Thr protein kinase)
MNDISLHVLDIAENCINAGAKNIEIIIDEDIKNDKLIIEINDDGKGMDKDTIEKLSDPFFTSRKTRKVGLGIPFLNESAMIANGNLTINSEPGQGTKVKAVFQYSHIDRKPLGDMPETLISLILLSGNSEIFYKHSKNGNVFEFNTVELKKSLNEESLKDVIILNKLKKVIQNKLSEL